MDTLIILNTPWLHEKTALVGGVMVRQKQNEKIYDADEGQVTPQTRYIMALT